MCCTFNHIIYLTNWRFEITYLVLISFVSSLRIMKSWSKIPGRCFKSWESGTARNALNQPRWNCLANTCLLYMCLISTGIKPSISNVGCSATMFWKQNEISLVVVRLVFKIHIYALIMNIFIYLCVLPLIVSLKARLPFVHFDRHLWSRCSLPKTRHWKAARYSLWQLSWNVKKG